MELHIEMYGRILVIETDNPVSIHHSQNSSKVFLRMYAAVNYLIENPIRVPLLVKLLVGSFSGGGSLRTADNQHVREHHEDSEISLQEAAEQHLPIAGAQTSWLSQCGGHKAPKAGPRYQTELD